MAQHPIVIDKAPKTIKQSKVMKLIFDSKLFSIYNVEYSESEDRGNNRGYGSAGSCVCIRDNVSEKMQEMDEKEALIFLSKKYAAHCQNPDPDCPFILEHVTDCPVI